MPKCKYCGSNITKFDKDICPICGAKNPFGGDDSQTVDITETIDTINQKDDKKIDCKQKSRLIRGFLCMFLGIFGIDDLYLGIKKRFLIRLCVSAVCYVALVAIFYFVFKDNIALMLLLPFLIIFAIYFVIGIILLFIKNQKDSNGVFLR